MYRFVLLFIFLFFQFGCEDKVSVSSLDENETKPALVKKITRDSVPLLVVLVNFNNQIIESSESQWYQKLFSENNNSLNHYYIEVSNENFKYLSANENWKNNDGIISVFLSDNHPNTDIDNLYMEDRIYGSVTKALVATDQYINFADYDTDGNGNITPDELTIVFIFAGFEDAYEGRHVYNGVWGHQNCMKNIDRIVTLDGVSLMGCANNGNFALFGEKHNYINPHDATIGIIAHELGHATFNLPDLYNTFDPYSGGIGMFGIMGSGTWSVKNNQEAAGTTPTHFTAWSKIYNGWIQAQEEKGNVTLFETASNEYNIIKIPIDAQHYYLLENRNKNGYDEGLLSLEGDFVGGIAIWKIDETKLTLQHIKDNDVNADTNNKGVDLVEAQDSLIDTQGGDGAANALFFKGNKDSYKDFITQISSSGNKMNLNIDY